MPAKSKAKTSRKSKPPPPKAPKSKPDLAEVQAKVSPMDTQPVIGDLNEEGTGGRYACCGKIPAYIQGNPGPHGEDCPTWIRGPRVEDRPTFLSLQTDSFIERASLDAKSLTTGGRPIPRTWKAFLEAFDARLDIYLGPPTKFN